MNILKTYPARNKIDSLSLLEIGFCFIFFVVLFILAAQNPFNSSPDEFMRYQIPYFIFSHGYLPHGYEPEFKNNLWGFSYAYYPFYIGPLISALFMKIGSFFSVGAFALVMSARFTSMLATTITVFFTFKIAKRLFERRFQWMMVILLSTIPQFIFLGTYVNNDSISVCGSAMIIYSWICGIQDDWKWSNTTLLSLGIVICSLSYYNAYGWILFSIIVYFGTWMSKNRKIDLKSMWRYAGLIVLIVGGCTAYFFTRNMILNHGDILGIHTINHQSEMHAIDNLKPSNRPTPQKLGYSLLDRRWFFHWANLSFKSFIGVFGYMNKFLPKIIYWWYAFLFFVSLVMFIPNAIRGTFNWKRLLFNTSLVIGCFIPLILSFLYSFGTDFQPQGRYLYPIIIALMIFVSKGFTYGIKKIKNNTMQKTIIVVLCSLQIAISIFSFIKYFLPS